MLRSGKTEFLEKENDIGNSGGTGNDINDTGDGHIMQNWKTQKGKEGNILKDNVHKRITGLC